MIARWQDTDPALVRGRVVVVIDVLRWSTVVLTALAHGARRVEAFAEPAEALARAEALGRPQVLLGGERGNVALPGFDVGNSPLEYSRARVDGKIVVTTTTNGTQALLAARGAASAVVGAFVNLPAVIDHIRTAIAATTTADAPMATGVAPTSVTFLCGGQAGIEALEDTCCAGAMVAALVDQQLVERGALDASAVRALELWEAHDRSSAAVLSAAPHARTLAQAGFEGDLHAAGRIGALDFAPRSGVEVTTPA